jgi:hypothetical protein
MIDLFDQHCDANNGGNIWFLILSVVMGIIILQPYSSVAMGTKRLPEGKGLYIYSDREISSFLKDKGYSDYWMSTGKIVARNSDGTELRFFSQSKRKVVTAACDGSIKELDIPGFPTWLNDKHDAVAWHDWDKSIVHYKNGMIEKISKAFGRGSGPDPSGNYFMKYSSPSYDIPLSQSCKSEIYSIERPDSPLATVAVCGVRRIFVKDAKVFLFGYDYREDNFNNIDITASIFRQENDRLLQVEKMTIRPPRNSSAPFYVEDFSPWHDEVFLIDVHDMPIRSVWYSFNLKTHEMKKIGKVPFGGGYGFYLQCNIIKEVMKKQKEKKVGE